MLEMTNLGWPVTPYGSTAQIVKKPRRLLTGIAALWADDDGSPVLMSAAAVFLDVHRTKPVTVTDGTVNFGYRALAAEGPDDTERLLSALDVLFVQARRDAPAITWHAAQDDLHVMEALRPGRAGVTGLSEAWAGRSHPEKGIARCVDTAKDVGPDGLLAKTADAAGLPFGPWLRPLQDQEHTQQLYELLLKHPDDPTSKALATQGAAIGALAQALVTAFIGGRHLDHLTWDTPPNAFEAVRDAACDEFPDLFHPSLPA
ncbi:hypothetical protein [Streptomyces sp. NPDC002889]|uniref:hypothetical protein n=1 Tax=Streptomyces sp. NPDC002889 TaxID=3364669 RepID=UPI0036745954